MAFKSAKGWLGGGLVVGLMAARSMGGETNPAPAVRPPMVTEALSPLLTAKKGVTNTTPRLALGNLLELRVEALQEWAAGPTNDPRNLVLFVNGIPLRKLYPEEVGTQENRLVYHLRITPDNQDGWDDLLRQPVLQRPVTLSVGLENGGPFPTRYNHANRAVLEIIPSFWGGLCLTLLGSAGLAFLQLARRTNLLRDPDLPAGGGRPPYNLGRVQMALWLFLILGSYSLIWLITGNLDTITGSLLGLMGVSAATALGDAAVDSRKTTEQSEAQALLETERATLRARLAELDRLLGAGTVADAEAGLWRVERAEKQTRLETVEAKLTGVRQAAISPASQGWLRDILSDGEGVTLHRFQIVVWTAVLAVIFVASVYNNLKMPEFSTNLLALMGLSAGTYLGFRFPEK